MLARIVIHKNWVLSWLYADRAARIHVITFEMQYVEFEYDHGIPQSRKSFYSMPI